MKTIFPVIISILCFSCWTIETDPTGESDFVIENRTDSTIYFNYSVTSLYAELGDSSLSIGKREQITFLPEVFGGIGVPALPSEVFKKINIYSDELRNHEIYQQYPVVDSLWSRKSADGYEAWRYSIYTLVIE